MLLQYCLLLYFFNCQQKTSQKRITKINNLIFFLLILLGIHVLLILALVMISDIFDLKGKFIVNILRNKKNCFKFIIIFSVIFIFLTMLILTFFDVKYVQILNFIFSFLLIFEVCIKISQSTRFINWIGEQLDKTFRIFVMFIITLNCTYFFTRFTQQIIESF